MLEREESPRGAGAAENANGVACMGVLSLWVLGRALEGRLRVDERDAS